MTSTKYIPSLGQSQTSTPASESGILTRIDKALHSSRPAPTSPQIALNRRFLERRLASSPSVVQQNIDLNPSIMHGNPIFRGTRIPLYTVVEELADGSSLREILEGYPSLSIEKLQAGLDFAASLLRLYADEIPD